MKQKYIADVSYQKYVLEHCGVKVTGVYLVCIDTSYVLEGVHNGTEAISIFPQIQYMEAEEAEKARRNLLAYCRLDTLAMVKVWEELNCQEKIP